MSCLTLILLKIFDIYFCHYFARKKKIAITHLWHAMEPWTMCHLKANNKVAEQCILGKYSKCNSFGVAIYLLNSKNFKAVVTQLYNVIAYYVIAYQKLDE